MYSTVISVRHLSKSFISETNSNQKIFALRDINLDVREGEVLGILGPNGAGKTTFLNILSTLLIPDQGQLNILGLDYSRANYFKIRGLINMSSGYPNFPWSLTVEENLRFYGRLYGLDGKILEKKISELCELFNLNDYRKRRFDELSSGTKQRLSLAKALMNNPKIIFLDEPTVGLDPDVAAKTREVILRVLRKSRKTVLLTTHYMKEADMMCDRIAFIKEGRLIKLATPDQLKTSQKKDDLEEVFIELAKLKESAGVNAENVSSGNMVIERDPVQPLTKPMIDWFRRCWAFSCRNFLFAMRNAFAFAELVFWPVVTLFSIGLMGNFLELGTQARDFILTGAIAGGILQVSQLDVAYSLLYEVWSKSMKHTMLTPVGVSEHLFGSWLIGVLRGLIILVILSASAIFFFDYHFPPAAVTIIFLAGLFLSALLLGMLVSFLILMFGQKAEITAWMFAYLFMLICGIYYPVETLPPALYHLSQWVPITYFLSYFRGQSAEMFPWKGFALSIFYLIFGLNLMKYAFHQARRKGIIVKLSE